MPRHDPQLKRRLAVLTHAQESRNVSKTCRFFGISRDTFYEWKKAYVRGGEAGLLPTKRGPRNPHPNRLPESLQHQILQIRRDFNFGPQRIVWYLARYYGVKVSTGGVYGTLLRNGLNILPNTVSVRSIPSWHRYEKEVPGHHVQVDVKFLDLVTQDGRRVRRFQYTAIDDATRVRALKIYPAHNQRTAIEFVDYVLERFPFRVRQIRTDRGHEFQAQFHWHVEELGIQHVYIKPRSPRLNGKVERSHRTDAMEFYQLLSYKDDVDLAAKLAEWERFYNLVRPHGAHHGKTPYEVLRERLSSTPECQAPA
jgi:transposase InsO family protein